jgi:hypothetical protein
MDHARPFCHLAGHMSGGAMASVINLGGGSLLGLAIGMRHALEPDHLAAISTMVAERPHARTAALIGATWGLGHALALILVGGLLLVLRAQLPAWLATSLEGAVAVMLVLLGLRALARAVRLGRAGAVASHQHGGHRHTHLGPTRHLHLGRITLATGPLLIGLMHGLAGSGTLVVITMASAPGLAAGLIYMLCFGLGSVLGMALVSGVSSLSLTRLATSPRGAMVLAASSGLLSLAVGVIWGLRIIA